MILVDTSVWIDHIRAPREELQALLHANRVLGHPFVIGEVAVGRIASRVAVLTSMKLLPRAVTAQEDEVLGLIEGLELFGRGIGYVDAHLLAATRLTHGSRLWTRDRRLLAIARELHVAHEI